MKQYKLIKEYPYSPVLGTELTQLKDVWCEIDGKSPFYRESQLNFCFIDSVKRLSDGEIFTIDDTAKYITGNPQKIISFSPTVTNEIVVKLEFNEYYLKSIVKVKQPLFTTEDEVDIYEGDDYYWILDGTNSSWSIHKNDCLNKNDKQYIKFSTKKAAENYIICNKPCLSLKEVLQEYNKCAAKDSPLYNKLKATLRSLIKSKL